MWNRILSFLRRQRPEHKPQLLVAPGSYLPVAVAEETVLDLTDVPMPLAVRYVGMITRFQSELQRSLSERRN